MTKRIRPGAAQSMMAVLGPRVTYAYASEADVNLLFDRPNLSALARAEHWPQPLTAVVKQIIAERKPDGLKTSFGVERFLDLCWQIILDTARVETDELLAALEADESEHESLLKEWLTQAQAMQAKIEKTASLTKKAELGRELAEFQKAPPRRPTREVDAALYRVKPKELRPLFVLENPDDDQWVLLGLEDERRPDPIERLWRFTTNDLLAVGTYILSSQEGGLFRFRAEQGDALGLLGVLEALADQPVESNGADPQAVDDADGGGPGSGGRRVRQARGRRDRTGTG